MHRTERFRRVCWRVTVSRNLRIALKIDLPTARRQIMCSGTTLFKRDITFAHARNRIRRNLARAELLAADSQRPHAKVLVNNVTKRNRHRRVTRGRMQSVKVCESTVGQAETRKDCRSRSQSTMPVRRRLGSVEWVVVGSTVVEAVVQKLAVATIVENPMSIGAPCLHPSCPTCYQR